MNQNTVGDNSDNNDSAFQEERERAEFQVGGIDRELSPEQQLDQLASYIHAHYEAPEKNPPWSDNPSDPLLADTFDARLPDRITHSAMLMLGAAVDHSMPGVAFSQEVTVEDVPELDAQLFIPPNPNGRFAVSLHPGGWWKGAGVALTNAWRPEVAAVAQLSGVTMLDLDYPLVPAHTLPEVLEAVAAAVGWLRSTKQATWVGAWGYSSGGALAVLSSQLFDALALTFPHLDLSMLPESVRAGTDSFPTTLPPTFIQVATHDTIADRYEWAEAQASAVKEYVSEHRISTPKVARERVQDVAEFLAGNVR